MWQKVGATQSPELTSEAHLLKGILLYPLPRSPHWVVSMIRGCSCYCFRLSLSNLHEIIQLLRGRIGIETQAAWLRVCAPSTSSGCCPSRLGNIVLIVWLRTIPVQKTWGVLQCSENLSSGIRLQQIIEQLGSSIFWFGYQERY